MPRDKLLVLFWPESDTDRARHALDQTLYSLKRELGAESLVLGREELSLNPAVITSDVADFKVALANGDHASAVELYTGAFLDGVYLSGAPEFERWVDDERAARMHDVESALETLATSAAARGDHQAAAQWLQRLAARNPRRTRVVVALMSELAASGDRSGALRHADIYHTLVRDDPDVEPNPAVAALADKLRREPTVRESPPAPVYEMPADVAPPPPQALSPPQPVVSPTGRRLTPRAYRVAAVAAVVLAVGLSTAWMFWNRHRVEERAWILPADFENRTRDSVFDRALDAALTTGLQQSAYVNVFPRSRVQQTLVRMERVGRGVSAPPLDESLAREVAQREGISAVVVGAVDRVDSSYMVTLRLVDATSGAALAAESKVARRRADVIDVVDDLVRRIRRDIGESASALAKHDRPLPQATTRSLEALHKYAAANAAMQEGRRAEAIELWERAVALDSDFALAHAELGAAAYFGNDRPLGEAHFARALRTLDRLTDREQLLVRAAVERWRGNRERAIALRRALLDQYPGDPSAWGQIGYDFMRLGRDREAIDALRKQLARDSSNASVWINLATSYKGLGDYTEALRAYARAFALQPTLLRVNNLNHEYGLALVLSGHLAEARAAYDTMLHGDADQRAQGERSIGLLFMLQGRYGDAVERFRKATMLSHVPNRALTEARNHLFLAAAQQEKGWRDSARTELRAAHALFRRAYFEPAFLMYLGKALVRDGQMPLAAEVLDTLRRRAQSTIDRANLLVLAGEMAIVQGRADSAVRSFRLAYATDSSAYVAESLARGLAAAGDVAGAARAYESLAASRDEWYGWEGEQYGLTAPHTAAALYDRMGDSARARTNYERLLSQWPAGDSDLVSVRQSRDALARLRRGTRVLQPERR